MSSHRPRSLAPAQECRGSSGLSEKVPPVVAPRLQANHCQRSEGRSTQCRQQLAWSYGSANIMFPLHAMLLESRPQACSAAQHLLQTCCDPPRSGRQLQTEGTSGTSPPQVPASALYGPWSHADCRHTLKEHPMHLLGPPASGPAW